MDVCMHVRMNATHLEDPLIKSGEYAAWRLAICLESGNNVGWDRDEEITGANPDTWLEHYGALSRRLDSHNMPRTPGFTRASIREHHIGSDRGKLTTCQTTRDGANRCVSGSATGGTLWQLADASTCTTCLPGLMQDCRSPPCSKQAARSLADIRRYDRCILPFLICAVRTVTVSRQDGGARPSLDDTALPK